MNSQGSSGRSNSTWTRSSISAFAASAFGQVRITWRVSSSVTSPGPKTLTTISALFGPRSSITGTDMVTDPRAGLVQSKSSARAAATPDRAYGRKT